MWGKGARTALRRACSSARFCSAACSASSSELRISLLPPCTDTHRHCQTLLGATSQDVAMPRTNHTSTRTFVGLSADFNLRATCQSSGTNAGAITFAGPPFCEVPPATSEAAGLLCERCFGPAEFLTGAWDACTCTAACMMSCVLPSAALAELSSCSPTRSSYHIHTIVSRAAQMHGAITPCTATAMHRLHAPATTQ